MNRLILNSLTFGVALSAGVAQAGVIFQDTFDRADSRNIDASLTGITDNTGSSLAADGVYTHAFVDPANDPGPQDGDAVNGGGAAIVGNQLRLAIGAGTSNAYINHNFTNPSITSEGALKVTMNVIETEGATGDGGQGGAFAIGMSQAEAASGGDAFGSSAGGNAYQAAFNDTNTVVSDFWVALKANNELQWGSNGDAGLVNVGSDGGEVSVVFGVGDFNAGSSVGFEVFYNGASQGTGSFTWSGTDENYIGLDARDNGFVAFDELTIESVPEPGTVALLALGGLAMARRRRK